MTYSVLKVPLNPDQPTNRAGQRHTHRQTSQLVFTARLRPQFGMPPSFDCCMLPRRWFNQNIPLSIVLLQQWHCRNRHRGKLQNLSPPSVLFESSRFFFAIHKRHKRKKWWTRILKFEFCDFWEFFEILKKRHCAVPLRPIWSFMVAAKLGQSRVLVTKFRQNRLTLKGRSAGQRHKDRQTRLKIRAL